MKFLKSKIVLGIFWLILSVSLGVWWMLLGLNQSKQILDLQLQFGKKFEAELFYQKQTRMIKMEGSFFILLLILGGSTLLILTQREYDRSNTLKSFFATLTHEMKTPLASLRLQAESLEEEVKSKQVKIILNRLVDDTKRLELQMDKALYLASINRKESLYFEKINLNQFLENLQSSYSILKLSLSETIFIQADRRALESVCKNLIENSIHHGEATKINISTRTLNSDSEICFSDNGKGFAGNINKLGKLYYRHQTSSGSGIGIYLIQNLISKMQGTVFFQNTNQGFEAKLKIPVWTKA
jgi:signal transduction histidine kinase